MLQYQHTMQQCSSAPDVTCTRGYSLLSNCVMAALHVHMHRAANLLQAQHQAVHVTGESRWRWTWLPACTGCTPTALSTLT